MIFTVKVRRQRGNIRTKWVKIAPLEPNLHDKNIFWKDIVRPSKWSLTTFIQISFWQNIWNFQLSFWICSIRFLVSRVVHSACSAARSAAVTIIYFGKTDKGLASSWCGLWKLNNNSHLMQVEVVSFGDYKVELCTDAQCNILQIFCHTFV